MTTYDLTVAPTRVRTLLRSSGAIAQATFGAGFQTIDRGGDFWMATLTFENRTGADEAVLMSLIAKLRGQVNRVRVVARDNPNRGAYGGTPLVAGASQTGTSLNIDGATNSVTNWIREGDRFSVVVNGEYELKIATADASSDGSGAVTLTFEPPLRDSPADNAVILVEDGTLLAPRGVFALASVENGWESEHNGSGSLSQFTLELMEDVFATQS